MQGYLVSNRAHLESSHRAQQHLNIRDKSHDFLDAHPGFGQHGISISNLWHAHTRAPRKSPIRIREKGKPSGAKKCFVRLRRSEWVACVILTQAQKQNTMIKSWPRQNRLKRISNSGKAPITEETKKAYSRGGPTSSSLFQPRRPTACKGPEDRPLRLGPHFANQTLFLLGHSKDNAHVFRHICKQEKSRSVS